MLFVSPLIHHYFITVMNMSLYFIFFTENLRLPTSSVVYCPPVPVNASSNCTPSKKPCLFHIKDDPCEFYNLADSRPGNV